MRQIIGVTSVWQGVGWEVAYIDTRRPGVNTNYYSKRTHPTELQAYVDTLKWLTELDHKEQTNGTST